MTRDEPLLIYRTVDGLVTPEKFDALQSLLAADDEAPAFYCSQANMHGFLIDSTGRNVPGVAGTATGESEAACGSKFVADGNWHHIPVVFDPEKGSRLDQGVSIYVDGQLEYISHATPAPIGTMKSGAILIGRHINHSTLPELAFTGSIDDLYVFKATLPEDEIRRLAANRSPS